MDNLRIGSFDLFDSHSDRLKDGSKKRSRQPQIEREDEPVDQVTLSSAGETEEQPSGYCPPSSEPE
jgi:hypothetical protein